MRSLHQIILNDYTSPDMTLTVDGLRRQVALGARRSEWWVKTQSGIVRLDEVALLPEPQRAAGAGGSLRAPMPGTVLAVLVEVGQTVVEGQSLMKLEAMKMEHTIRAATAGVVEAIYFAAGDPVAVDDLLARISANVD